MDLAYQNLQSVKNTPARWALFVLIFGLLITYPILDYVVISHVRYNLTQRQYNSQMIAASAMRSIVALSILNGESPATAFNSAIVSTSLGQTSAVSAALVAPDGTITAFHDGFELAGAENLSNFKVVDWPTGFELGFKEFVTGTSRKGRFIRPQGGNTGHLICAASLPGLDWHVITIQRYAGIENSTSTTRLYLLVAFLVLAVFLVLLILSFYFTLAAGLASAINSARALDVASVRFQEKAGELRRPLHNIQGLADMLSITEDPDERERYLNEIKSEVKLVIEDLEKFSS